MRSSSAWGFLKISICFLENFDLFLFFTGILISILSGYVHNQHFYVIRQIWQLFIEKEKILTKNELSNSTNLEDLIDFNDRLSASCWSVFKFGIFSAVLVFLMKTTFMTVAENLCHRMRQRAFMIILNKDLIWFDEKKTTVLSANIIESLEKLNNGFGIILAHIVRHFVMLIFGAILAFSYDSSLALLMFSITIVSSFVSYFFNKIEEKLQASMSSYDNANAITQQALSCIRTVQAFNGQKHEEVKYKSALDDCIKIDMQVQMYLGLSTAFLYSMSTIINGLQFWIATEYVYWGLAQLQTVLIVGRAARAACSSFGELLSDWSQFRRNLVESQTLFELLGNDLKETNAKLSRKTREYENLELTGKLEIKDLSFTYHNREAQVLKNISFTCEPGEMVALVGSSGCGKSTLLQLVQRFYEPTSGKIFIGDRCIDSFPKTELRPQFGVVGQEPVLFNSSIIENIRFANPSATEAEVTLALQKANALDFVKRLPKGWHTRVGERGTQLSGGQKQRIAIARAIIRNPKFLLLDEATSALDGESEKEVLKALEKASKGRTTVVVAHRLSTIRNADKILVINQGTIVESGTHDVLMKLEGHYAGLVKAQLTERMPSHRQSTDEELHFTENEREELLVHFVSGNDDEEHEKDVERIKKEAQEEGVLDFSGIELFKEALPDWKYLLLGLFVCSFEGVFMPAYQLPQATALQSFAELDPEEQRRKGRIAAIWMILPILADFFATPLEVLGFETTANRLSTRLRTKIYSNLLHQDGSFFDIPQHAAGRLTTRLATDAYFMRRAVGFKLSYFLKGILALIVGLFVSFYYCWPMAVLMTPMIPILAFIETIWRGVFEASSYEDKKLIEESGRLMTECVENIKTVHSLNMETVMHERFCELIERPHQRNIRKVFAQGVISGLHESLATFLRAIEYSLGGWIINSGYGRPLDVFRALMVMDSAGHYFGETFVYLPEYRKARLAAALVFKLKRESEIKNDEDRKSLQDNFGQITFEDVTFAYPQRAEANVLDGISFSIDSGQKVALVGSSGSGKSTITALLQRFYEPNQGKIKVNNYDITFLSKNDLRAHFGLVSQEPILFDESIFANICYGLPEELISREQVIEAAKSANIHSFIESLPDGYKTRVGNKGSYLSGGQKQRIAIARALVRNPNFLIFDEATSALDAESEKIVQEALDSASFGRTCLIIAHRLSTVKNADKIIVLSNGKIVEQGTHTELLEKHGAYYKLVRHQKTR